MLPTVPMLLLAALLMLRPAAAEAPARLSASMAAALEQQAQLVAAQKGDPLEMRSSSTSSSGGTAVSKQEAVAEYAARLTDALVGGQPPAPHNLDTRGTHSTAASLQPLHYGNHETIAPLSQTERHTAAAPKPTSSMITTIRAATQPGRGYPALEKPPPGLSTAALLASEAMLRELVADAAEAAAASARLTLPPAQAATPTASKPWAPGTTWSADLIFDHNASSVGFSNRPGAGVNSSERGAFDIRAGWSTKRRYIHLPGQVGGRSDTIQEVIETQVYFSISALALACLATALLLLVVHQCTADERGDQGAGEEEEQGGALATAGSGEDAARETFIKQVGYVKL